MTIGSGVVVLAALLAFVAVERTAENPVVPFSLFFDRNRLATYATMFLSGGVGFTLSVLIALYVQNVMGYSPLQAGISFIPFAIAQATGMGASSQLVKWFPPRVVVIAGGILVFAAMLYGSTLDRDVPYFPNLVVPLIIGGIGLGMLEIPLMLSLIASVGSDRIGPASAVAVMVRMIGGPLVLVAVQALITFRTIQLGGTHGPVRSMNDAQLNALDDGFTDGLLALGGVVILLGAVALMHRLHRAAGGEGAGGQESQRRCGTIASLNPREATALNSGTRAQPFRPQSAEAARMSPGHGRRSCFRAS